jgi:hypothetical protein
MRHLVELLDTSGPMSFAETSAIDFENTEENILYSWERLSPCVSTTMPMQS